MCRYLAAQQLQSDIAESLLLTVLTARERLYARLSSAQN